MTETILPTAERFKAKSILQERIFSTEEELKSFVDNFDVNLAIENKYDKNKWLKL